MIVDANLLLYAVDSASPQHEAAADWLSAALNGDRRVALSWQSIGSFLRISTHPRVSDSPLTGADAWAIVAAWLDAPTTWVPPATERTAAILGDFMRRPDVTANLVPDAQLAALALEHGLTVFSADTDFARFPGLRWENPLSPD